MTMTRLTETLINAELTQLEMESYVEGTKINFGSAHGGTYHNFLDDSNKRNDYDSEFKDVVTCLNYNMQDAGQE
jgi:hypothetical protein